MSIPSADQNLKPTPADVTPPGVGPETPPSPGDKAFVPFFNEDYEFRLGTLGETGTAYRLGAIFVFMLVAAALMYMGAWWFVGTHPLAQHH